MENLELESIQINGIMGFVQGLPMILDNYRDGMPLKAYTKTDILALVNFMSKMDKRHWMDYLNGKTIFCIDKEGKPCLREVTKFYTIKNDYLADKNGAKN